MSKQPARDRLARAALALFDERGYEQTTVDDITERAGLGRSTFFRYYRSKEDVIFPDHDRLLQQVSDRLATSGHRAALEAVCDAVRLVLLHYLEEGDLAHRRYALTSTVPALRDREIASVARYQRLFREFIAARMADPAEPAPLRAELMAAAVVAAHNHVLRRWLRGESPDPVAEVDQALDRVGALFTADAARANGAGTTIVAFRSGQDLDALLPSLRRITEGEAGGELPAAPAEPRCGAGLPCTCPGARSRPTSPPSWSSRTSGPGSRWPGSSPPGEPAHSRGSWPGTELAMIIGRMAP